MRVQVFDQPRSVSEAQLHNRTVIVIDLLRATTTITTAIENGAKQVIPAKDPGEAIALYGSLGRGETLLGGERGGLKLPDFHFGNSPLEYSAAAVKEKTVILATTNGTNTILTARNAARVLMGCMRNRTAVAKEALSGEEEMDIVILCAGTEGMFSADDICCAGAIVSAIMAETAGREDISYNDLALVSLRIYQDWKEGRMDLSSTFHYSRLVGLNFHDDLRFCLTEDASNTVPCYRNGVVVGE